MSELKTNNRTMVTIDGNEAAAYVAHKLNEVIAIYPITPASTMGEWSDEWSAKGRKNLWGTVPAVVEMQSEAGAAGAVHGALQTGALATTFTASQGLLLMIPNMFKIAGELTPTVFHIAARTVATHALSIFGDHSDVMAVRSTGWAMLASNSVQEAMDFSLIAQVATLESRVPFLHFFDGFRTSAEVGKIELISDDQMKTLVDNDLILAHRLRALSPDHPVMRGSAQNPDVFFQARERSNPYYFACPAIVEKAMEKFETVTGRRYRLFEYFGDPQAEKVIVIMGSGAETVQETVDFLNRKGEKVGLMKVRLYRPFSVEHLTAALPPSVQSIAVLDRTKESGAVGEPLYVDVVTALSQAFERGATGFKKFPTIVGGRYGLSSKEFTPAMVKAVFDEMNQKKPRTHFTVGIEDDVTNMSLNYDASFSIEPNDVVRGIFFGLGADGTVGANKNSIKIIGEETELYAQGYFVYDSKKSGSRTTSHLRFGPRPIHAPYLIERANFVACHQWVFLERFDVLEHAIPGSTFLLNSMYGPEAVWDRLPRQIQKHIIEKNIKFYVIDAYKVAQQTGMGNRINTIMQTCFFAISGILPKDDAIAAIKEAIRKTYGKKGEQVVKKNFEAVDQTLENLFQVKVPASVTSDKELPPVVSEKAPKFVQDVTARIIAGDGYSLPVSAFPVDGTFPVGTAQWEKRNIALEIPVWEPDLCIQCNKCALVCPHATIRVKAYEPKHLASAPSTFKSMDYRGTEFKGMKYTVQIGPEDCTGCTLCVEVCPGHSKTDPEKKSLAMRPQAPLRDAERENYGFFLKLPEVDRTGLKYETVKGSQFLQPLFEYSGACSGCGETPYLKLVSQLFGDRSIIANATGCSSIYGGNLPTTPWTTNNDGRGPAWSNSLFEDNAEFGLGMRLTTDKLTQIAQELVQQLTPEIGNGLAQEILASDQTNEAGIFEQRQRVQRLKEMLKKLPSDDAKRLLSVADNLVKRSVWIVGGDGWAYDIGFGGLDHVMASGKNVNILVLDTEVYSNTGGQMSKSTSRSAMAKFAASGKTMSKKDLAMIAMSYTNVYVARVAFGANDAQTVRAFLEAESYDGPSLIIAYAHCIEHGLDMTQGLANQKLAVETGYWPLFRFDPRMRNQGKNPFKIDSKAPKLPLKDFTSKETRFNMLGKVNPEHSQELEELAQRDVNDRWALYEKFANVLDTSKTGAAKGGDGKQEIVKAQTS